MKAERRFENFIFIDINNYNIQYFRSARNEGIWMENSALCKITKTVCNILENFGFQDKTGIYLLPEETLFLIEEVYLIKSTFYFISFIFLFRINYN